MSRITGTTVGLMLLLCSCAPMHSYIVTVDGSDISCRESDVSKEIVMKHNYLMKRKGGDIVILSCPNTCIHFHVDARSKRRAIKKIKSEL